MKKKTQRENGLKQEKHTQANHPYRGRILNHNACHPGQLQRYEMETKNIPKS